MKHRTSSWLYGVLGLLLLGCADQPKTAVFFGGQIINPSSDYVTLYKDNKAIDCLKLNAENRFFKQYDTLAAGIYNIEHIPEYQAVFLEPGDSMWVRINASAFRESMVFSGLGAPKNNYLIDLQLRMDREDDFLTEQYAGSADRFHQIIDSLQAEKQLLWRLLDSLNRQSLLAKTITEAAYQYPYATRRERYALLRGSQWSTQEDSAYFAFRSSLNLEEKALSFFDPYINYLMNYLNQEALDSGQNYFQQKQKTAFHQKRLQIIDKSFTYPALKNNLARAVAIEELLNFQNHNQHDAFLEYYFSINSSKDYVSDVLSMHNDINHLNSGVVLPTVELQNSALEIVRSNQLFDGRPVVLYFWSQTQMNHYRRAIERMQFLQKKYPKIRFVGISIQQFNGMALQANKVLGVNPNNQFAIHQFDTASKEWVITLLNKAIITDGKGVLIEGFGNFQSPEIEEILDRF
jgi:thiol-disulfide isomerase/thioredoxin